MKNSKNGSAVATGIFVTAGIAILLSGLFLIGNKSNSFSKTVVAKAVFEDVNGLAKGNNVWYSGVKVGVVKRVDFTDDGVEVSFSIDNEISRRIHTDTKVKLGSDGLIGNKILVLYGGTAAAPPMVSGSHLSVEAAVSTETMMATLQDNNKNLLQITDDFKTLSKGLVEGKGTIGKLLTDESLLNSLKTTMYTLNKASSNTELLTANLSDFTRKLNSKGSLTNDLLTDTTIFITLKSTVAQLQAVSLNTNKIVENLGKTTESLNNKKGTVGMLLNDEVAATGIRNTLVSLQAGTQKLDENMEALQHNFLLRGFFRKKAKKEEARNKDSLSRIVARY